MSVIQRSSSIHAPDLLNVARQQTGLHDLGPCGEIVSHGWTILADSISSSRRFDQRGMSFIKETILSWITAHLKQQEDFRRFPEIADVSVANPVFIVDYGRAGSTFLHNLLAQDPAARTPVLWELWTPSPPVGLDAAEEHRRINIARRRIELMRKWSPESLLIHPLSETAPEECHWLIPHGTHYALQYQSAEYWEWLRDLDLQALKLLHENYRRQVQALQLHRRKDFWLSKSMSHLHFLPVFHDVFPDANIIRLHRDPCKVIPSICSLYKNTRFGYLPNNSDPELGMMALDMFVDGAERMTGMDGHWSRAQIIDIEFGDLIKDPFATIQRIYDRFGRSLDSEVERRLKAYIEPNDGTKASIHRYSLKDFGLSEDMVQKRTRNYRDWLAATIA